MKIRYSRTACATLAGSLALLLFLGCGKNARPLAAETANAQRSSTDALKVARAVLGAEAEVIAQGDLAKNGSEQMLVINRLGRSVDVSLATLTAPSTVLITRAAIVEKRAGDNWTEVLRCDAHLKNQNGFLGGLTLGPVAGWQLDYTSEPAEGLRMKFTPANGSIDKQESSKSSTERRGMAVRWNTKTKRYQAFDQSQEKYLGETPTLETPQSFLR